MKTWSHRGLKIVVNIFQGGRCIGKFSDECRGEVCHYRSCKVIELTAKVQLFVLLEKSSWAPRSTHSQIVVIINFNKII